MKSYCHGSPFLADAFKGKREAILEKKRYKWMLAVNAFSIHFLWIHLVFQLKDIKKPQFLSYFKLDFQPILKMILLKIRN